MKNYTEYMNKPEVYTSTPEELMDKLKGKDVYALTRRTGGVDRTVWDIRRHNERNDEVLSQLSVNWNTRKDPSKPETLYQTVKIVENGQPLIDADYETLKAIPTSAMTQRGHIPIVNDIKAKNQMGMGLYEYRKTIEQGKSLMDQFEGKDVYALVKDVGSDETRITWDVKKHNENNDDVVLSKADRWGRTVVKIIENGRPTNMQATLDDIREIPTKTQPSTNNIAIIKSTFNIVQGGLNLDEYNQNKQLESHTPQMSDVVYIQHSVDALADLYGKDVYALVDSIDEVGNFAQWDVREHNDGNDYAVTEFAEDTGQKVIKVVENGELTCSNLSQESIASIPLESGIHACHNDLLPQVLEEVQLNQDYSDYQLFSSMHELQAQERDEIEL